MTDPTPDPAAIANAQPPTYTSADGSDVERQADEHAHLHDLDGLFDHGQREGWKPIGEPTMLVDAGAEAGVTIAATATDHGTVAFTTVVTQNDAGESVTPTKTTLQLDPAALIRLASMVPPELLDPHAGGGADVIQLHPGPVMNDVVVIENGITNAPCQATGCERRIQQDADGEWDHLPDALGLKPEHAAVPPATLLDDQAVEVDSVERTVD